MRTGKCLMDKFSSHLKRLMAEKGVTQAELAARAALTQGSVSKYINGHQEPKSRELYAISKALGVSMESWFEDEPRMGIPTPLPDINWHSRALIAEEKLKILRAAFQKIDKPGAC